MNLKQIFTNQINKSIKYHQVEKNSLPKSLLNPYSVSGIPFGFKNEKPRKRNVIEVFMWAQLDLNQRPSDYESDALTN